MKIMYVIITMAPVFGGLCLVDGVIAMLMSVLLTMKLCELLL